jgi:NAD(P)-dependent dehydrogenase (short-subunit alcohol dehydrogenase family)
MRGKRVVVTGASRGIGRETALALAAKGADLVLVVRDEARGRAVVEDLRARGGSGEVDLVVADLSSMGDVRRAAEEILAKHDTIDVLVNNAGALIMDRTLTKDGYEATFATNHLAYFLLTKLLLDALKRAPRARVVNVSSEAHRRGAIHFDDLMNERRWSGFFAYCCSKLANILFTAELARRLEGTNVTANALHPGAIASNFALDNRGFIAFAWRVAGPFLLTPEEGAKTTIFLASDPSVEGVTGKYFEKCAERKPSRKARDMDVAAKLWRVSEELVAR